MMSDFAQIIKLHVYKTHTRLDRFTDLRQHPKMRFKIVAKTAKFLNECSVARAVLPSIPPPLIYFRTIKLFLSQPCINLVRSVSRISDNRATDYRQLLLSAT